MKKSLSFTLALALCLGLSIPAAASSEMAKIGQVQTVSLGDGHMAVIDTNGTLWMCGYNRSGQLGNGTENNSASFVKIMDGVNSVSCGAYFTAAVKTDGSLWMWGYNYDGALTGDVKEHVLRPKKVLDGVVSVSCGSDHAAAIMEDGSLWLWGGNLNGQLGNGTTNDSTIPIRIMEDVAAVSCGSRTTAAIKKDGSLWMWGSNFQGRLGSGSMKGNLQLDNGNYVQTIPIKVMEQVDTVCCGGLSAAAIKKDGSLWVWGDNSCGQLANGSANWRGSATPSKVLENIASISIESGYAVAVAKDGRLWAWGDNFCGQLGNNYTGTNRLSNGAPLQLKPAVVSEKVAVAVSSSLATVVVKADNSLWACGRISSFSNVSNGTDPNGYPMQTQFVPLSGVKAKLFSSAAIAAKVGGFNDVRENDYCASPVLWAVKNNITAGISETSFSPSRTCTTAQVLTFLWRSQGQPEPSIQNPFDDVTADNYFYNAALWAHEKGLVDSSAFHGNAPCTRSAAVSYLWKLAGSLSAKPAAFTDVPAAADYAQAVAWAVDEGVTGGTSSQNFSPNATCTRGQIVTFLYRAYAR